MSKGSFSELTKAVTKTIDEMPVGTKFYGNQLQHLVSARYPDAEKKYTDTIMRIARKYRRYSYRTVNNRGEYERI